jgi:hypothetical protein
MQPEQQKDDAARTETGEKPQGSPSRGGDKSFDVID